MINYIISGLAITIFVIGAITCTTSQKAFYSEVTYLSTKGHPILKMKLPLGYRQEITQGGGNTYAFIYSDSSIIYIDGESYTGLNYDNIVKEDKYYSLFWAKHNNENIVVEGIDDNGMYWKNVLINSYGIGYLNVPSAKRLEYDSCLLSIKFINLN